MTDALLWAIGTIGLMLGAVLTYIIAKLGGMDDKLTNLLVGRAETNKDVEALKARVDKLEAQFDPGTTPLGEHS